DLVGRADMVVLCKRISDQRNEVADPDRLKSGAPAAGQRREIRWGDFLGKGDELAAVAEDHGRTENRPIEIRLAHYPFRATLRPDVGRRSSRIGSERAQLDEPSHTVGFGRPDRIFGPSEMNALVGRLARRLKQRRERDEIYHAISILELILDRVVGRDIADYGVHVFGEHRRVGVARECRDAMAAFCQFVAQISSDKPVATGYEYVHSSTYPPAS